MGEFMKPIWWIASTLAIAGCVSNTALQYDAISTNNIYHLARVRKGMGERDVLFIMKQPYRYETFEIGEDIYDVWFYVTQTTVLGQSRMVPQNLTPLTFRNGTLVGTGYDYYYYLIHEEAKQNAVEKPLPPPSVPVREPVQPTKRPETENKSLEKSLEKNLETPPKNAPPETEQPGNLQRTKSPTAPIISYQETPPPCKKLTSLFGVKNPLTQIHKGMTKDQVVATIGKPQDDQFFQLGDDLYEVWFYETSTKRGASRTPLTFKNGVLVGMTPKYYEGVRQAAGDTHVNGYDKKADQQKNQEIEQDFDYW